MFREGDRNRVIERAHDRIELCRFRKKKKREIDIDGSKYIAFRPDRLLIKITYVRVCVFVVGAGALMSNDSGNPAVKAVRSDQLFFTWWNVRDLRWRVVYAESKFISKHHYVTQSSLVRDVVRLWFDVSLPVYWMQQCLRWRILMNKRRRLARPDPSVYMLLVHIFQILMPIEERADDCVNGRKRKQILCG